jgi:hypothetical protein
MKTRVYKESRKAENEKRAAGIVSEGLKPGSTGETPTARCAQNFDFLPSCFPNLFFPLRLGSFASLR